VQQSEKWSIFEAGIDYITATATGGEKARLMYELSHHLKNESVTLGNQKKPWSMQGFHGSKAGACQSGIRGEETIIRLSSHLAHRYWLQAFQTADNVSRLDIQATVRTPLDVNRLVGEHFKQARRFFGSYKKKPAVTIHATNDGPSTVYFNQRISDRFGRIYNKFAESGSDHYRNCVRYEVELKNKACTSMITHLQKSSWSNTEAGRKSLEYFSQRGCSWQTSSGLPAFISEVPTFLCVLNSENQQPGVSDADRSLAWLRSGVRPTVDKLVGQVGLKEVLVALGLSEIAAPVPELSNFNELDSKELN